MTKRGAGLTCQRPMPTMATAIVSAIAGVGGECQAWNSMQEQRIERVFSHVAADNLGVGDVASITIF